MSNWGTRRTGTCDYWARVESKLLCLIKTSIVMTRRPSRTRTGHA
jgi:hypothetical protein